MQTLNDDVYHAYHQDEQGSTAYVTGNDGAVENCYLYDAFGNVVDSQGNIRNRILYTGQQYDQETGQYYLRARFYNPVIGRFTQEDTYRGDGLNLYIYCANNPVMYYDPNGYSEIGQCKKSEQAECEEQKAAGESGSNSVETPINSGNSKPKDTSTPNSIYEQLNSDGTVKSRAFYDQNGNQFSRQDFDHPHFDKKTQQYYQPHEHNYSYNENGQCNGKSDGPLPFGYSNQPTR